MRRRLLLTWALGLSCAATCLATPVTALVYSPDGAALISNGAKRLDIRSPKDGSIQSSIQCELPKITALAFDREGKILAASGGSPGEKGEILLFSWLDRKLLHRLAPSTDLVTSVAWNADGALLATASADHSATVWKFNNAKEPVPLFNLTGHAGPVLSIAFAPSGKTIVTASADRSLKVWSTEDGRLLRSFSQHTEAVHVIAFRPGESAFATCASGGDDRTVRVWQPEIGRMVRIIRQHEGPIFALAYSPDGQSLFSAGKEGIIRRIEADSDQILQTWPAQNQWIYSLAISPDGTKLAAGDWSGVVRLIQL